MSAEQNCLKCGALLPDADEGICPSCGTPFGKATMAMKVDPGELAAIAARKSQEQASAAPPPQMVNMGPQETSGSGNMGLIIGATVAIVVALVVVLLLVM